MDILGRSLFLAESVKNLDIWLIFQSLYIFRVTAKTIFCNSGTEFLTHDAPFLTANAQVSSCLD